ncbi:MAG: hypothetical protein ISQ17_00280 [Pelagibacteraceae bacterium]|nr:hypothetical protein [Pelagibacteraceae bacterium]
MGKKIIYIVLALIVYSCTLNKIDLVHGVSNLKNKSKLIILNETNKNSVRKILGPAPIIDEKEKRWTYFEVRESKSKYGKKIIYINDYIEIFFDNYGITKKIDFYDLNKMNYVKFSKEVTKSLAIEDSVTKNLLNSTRKRLENARKKYK